MSATGSNATPGRPSAARFFAAFSSSKIFGARSGSSVLGASPAKASAIARSVPWPLPVKASEPCKLTETRRAVPATGRRSSSTKRRAAIIGPTVWELDGPMPILKMSKTLRNIAALRPTFSPVAEDFPALSRQSAPQPRRH
jgi:hypothetical protein